MTKLIPTPGIFQSEWWLEVCAPGQWRRIDVDTRYGTLGFTYVYSKRFGCIPEIVRPPLTPFLGITFLSKREITSREQLAVSKQLIVLDEGIPQIIALLPPYFRFKLNFHPDFKWWSPFFWQEFQQHTRYTYRLRSLDKLDIIWDKFNSNAKRNITKASRSLTIEQDGRPDVLYSLFDRTMHNQMRRPSYSSALLDNLARETLKRGCGTVLVAYDKQARPHAAILAVWDEVECFYLVGGSDPNLRSSGAMSLLFWKAIEMAGKMGKRVFDFEGSMQRGIDRFLRNFGAKPVPYYQISKIKIPFMK